MNEVGGGGGGMLVVRKVSVEEGGNRRGFNLILTPESSSVIAPILVLSFPGCDRYDSGFLLV